MSAYHRHCQNVPQYRSEKMVRPYLYEERYRLTMLENKVPSKVFVPTRKYRRL
jgi:hypothetical protein